MPELPEVETVKCGLEKIISVGDSIADVNTSRQKLRFNWPRQFKTKLKGLKFQGLDRRAKYLLFQFGPLTLVNHLGMTGNWRLQGTDPKLKHDHLFLSFNTGKILVFNDPRRFGYVDLLPTSSITKAKWFEHLGPEPLGKNQFHLDYLWPIVKKRKAPIKNIIMDQKVVVGVGNIYASEALYMAGIRPTKPGMRLTKNQVQSLVAAIQTVLRQAIEAGGSTIKDFKQAGGSEGYFQTQFNVYGKGGQLCQKCNIPIHQNTIGGRSTFWCSNCQK